MNSPTDRRQIQLLLIEDDRALSQILSWHFEDLGYHMVCVHDCAQAIDVLSAQHFDLVLMDYQLPDGNSLDLLPTLRASQPGSPLVMMSAVADERVIEQASRQGVSAFAPKPVDPRALAATLGDLMAACP